MSSDSRVRPMLAAAFVLGALGGCGGGGGAKPQDASPDTPIDTPATCGGVTDFTGDIVDWDSTNTNPCGANATVWTVRGDTACKDTGNPNGRFMLKIPNQAQTLVDVVPSSTQCSTPSGTVTKTYQLSGVAIASNAVITASPEFSFRARAITQDRVTSMFTQIGQPFAGDHGQLLVHVIGTPRAVSISAGHAATQQFDGTTWAAGDTGNEVFFPNVDLGGGAVTVSMTGTSVGTGSYTLEPGKLTYLSVVAQ